MKEKLKEVILSKEYYVIKINDKKYLNCVEKPVDSIKDAKQYDSPPHHKNKEWGGTILEVTREYSVRVKSGEEKVL